MSELASLLDFAIDLADRAGRLTLGHFRTGTRPDWKADATPVTVADRDAETLIRHEIERRYPDHSVVGEEFGTTTGAAPWRWWIDPIDGTKPFLRGVPTYSTLIGLERDGRFVAGVAAFPAMGETIAAASGSGCRLNGRRCYVSRETDPAKSAVATTDWGRFAEQGRSEAAERVAEAFWIRAGWGDAYGYMLVASGRIEAMLDPIVAPYDVAPFPAILAEAGGRFCDWHGNPDVHSGSGVGVSEALADTVLDLLGERDGQSTDEPR